MPRYYTRPGPGPGGAAVLTMDDVTVNGRRVADTLDYVLYDTQRVKAGTALPTSEFRFFTIGLGGQQAGLNFATQYEKTEIDTNLDQSGMLPLGWLLRVDSIQCRIIFTGATDTTYGAAGAATEMPTNPAPAAIISAPNEEKAILEGGVWSFFIGTKDYENGKFIHAPAEFGISGFAGGGRDDEVDNCAIANNGFGRPRILKQSRWIKGLRNFRINAKFAYAITPNRNFNIEFALRGLLERNVQ